MLTLPPNPPHVLMPTDGEMNLARQLALAVPPRKWSQANCPLCLGTRSFVRWTGKPNESELGEYLCPCEDQMVLERWMGVRGIPDRYRKHTVWDAFGIDGAALQWFLAWGAEWRDRIRYGEGVVFHGPPGSGKTLLATLCLKMALQGGVTNGRMVEAAMTWRLGTWSDTEYRDYWNIKVRQAPLLVFDNLATEGGVLRQEDEIANMLRYRISNSLPTIVTTTLTPERIRETYKNGLLDVLRDACDFVPVRRDTPFDFRGVQQAERRLGIVRPTVFG